MRYPVVVENLNPRTCWQVWTPWNHDRRGLLQDVLFRVQELKDFGRLTGGTVAFCDIDRFNRNRG